MNCRHCATPLDVTFIDLGTAPPSNAYLSDAQLRGPERYYPLRVMVCLHCSLVQTEDYLGADDLFSPDYAYFTSYSDTALSHARRFVERMVERFDLGPSRTVVEIAANDGYLLQYVRDRGIPCYGVEPTQKVADAARAKGIDIVREFFGTDLAARLTRERSAADLAIANNVLAHVPDINDFTAGFPALLNHDGVASFEFPHVLKLISGRQFDTIYHEHYSYLSFTAVERIFGSNGLTVFDVEQLPTHGGSLRVFAQRTDTGRRPISAAVQRIRDVEQAAGVTTRNLYEGFQACADEVKDRFLEFLLSAKRAGKRVAAYGAAAKGNTLLNYAGVRSDLLRFVADRNPAKQGGFLPGSRIPIVAEERIAAERPDYIVVLPWNIKDEIMNQLRYVREWGGRFVTAIPELEIA